MLNPTIRPGRSTSDTQTMLSNQRQEIPRWFATTVVFTFDQPAEVATRASSGSEGDNRGVRHRQRRWEHAADDLSRAQAAEVEGAAGEQRRRPPSHRHLCGNVGPVAVTHIAVTTQ